MANKALDSIVNDVAGGTVTGMLAGTTNIGSLVNAAGTGRYL